MPAWTTTYRKTLLERFDSLAGGFADRFDARGVWPMVDEVAAGSGQLRAAVLAFDIYGFRSQTGSSDSQALTRELLMLDCVIPMVTQVVQDHGGHVERNAPESLSGVIASGATDEQAANESLDAALTIVHVLSTIVNPYLALFGIPAVEARMGIDIGQLSREAVTAVGPAAIIASRLRDLAGPHEVLVGDLVVRNASRYGGAFLPATPADWTWTYEGSPYWVWRCSAVRTVPD